MSDHRTHRVYVVRLDDAYGGGADVIGVYASESAAKLAAEDHARLAWNKSKPMVWSDESVEIGCEDTWEGRPGGFSLAESCGAAYAISEHDLAIEGAPEP